jgi:putative oxidoreductase
LLHLLYPKLRRSDFLASIVWLHVESLLALPDSPLCLGPDALVKVLHPIRATISGAAETNENVQDGHMDPLQQLDLSPTSAVGAALLRFILAAFWLVHWWFKVGHRGMPATTAFFLQQGLPAWLAWFDIGFEMVLAVCLVLGIFVSPLCLISLPILFASMWIYRKNGFYFSGGGIEFPLLWACAQVAQAMLGPGAFRMLFPGWLPQLPTGFSIKF